MSLIVSHLLARDAVDLGRLVLFPKFPEQDFCGPSGTPASSGNAAESLVTANDVLVQHHHNFRQMLAKSSSSKLNLTLTALLGRTIYTLSNTQAVFERICSSSMHARQYLEKAHLRRRKVYFVIGLETLVNARLETQTSNMSSIGGEVTAPGELVLGAATGVPLPLGYILDVAIDSKWKKGKEGLSYFFAEGEQIFAIRYRKVDFRWFSKGSVANEAELKDKAVWKSFWTRGEEENEEEEFAIADVNHQLEASDLGRDAETVTCDDTTFLL